MSSPQTIGDVEVLLGNEASKLLSFRQEGDIVYAKPIRWMEKEVFRGILDRVVDLGGSYDQPNRCFIIPLRKASPKASATPTKPGIELVCASCGKRIGSETYTYVSGQPVHLDCQPKPASTPTPMARKEGFDVVPVTSILGFPHNLRLSLDEDEEFQGLTATVQSHGVLEPLIVRPKPDGVLELVCGDRRLRAAKKAGLLEVPVIIKDLTDKEAGKLRLIENLQRRDLTAYELALVLQGISVDYRNQEEMAKDLGKTQAWVSRHLHVLYLAEALHHNRVIMDRITLDQAEALLKTPVEKRQEIVADMTERVEAGEDLPSAREIEGMVKPPTEALHPRDEGDAGETPTRTYTEIPSETPTRVSTGSETARQEIDTNAVFTCNICQGKFLIVHREPSGKHGFKPLEGEAEPE